MLALAGQVLGDSLLRSQYDVSGEDGLAKDWWPDDPEASSLASFGFHMLPSSISFIFI